MKKLKSYKMAVGAEQVVGTGGDPEYVGITQVVGYPPIISFVCDPEKKNEVKIFMVKDGEEMPDVRCELVSLGAYMFGETRFGVFMPKPAEAAKDPTENAPRGVSGKTPKKAPKKAGSKK